MIRSEGGPDGEEVVRSAPSGRPDASWMLLAPALVAFAACGASTAGEAAAGSAPADRGPVVIELFTSQGCSSCPPADRLLSRLAAEPGYRGRVVPLAFHVDYWDYIGWRDPFSSPRWSERQRDYGRSLGLGTVYTPQLVIDGRSECVGSQEGDVRREIGRALATPAAGRVELSLSRGAGGGGDAGAVGGKAAAGKTPEVLRAVVRARLDAPAAGSRVEALVALVEDGLVTPVERGENARRTLQNDRVVRRLERAFVLPAEGGAEGAGEVAFPLEPAWRRANLSVVAFLQDVDSRAILGAAAADAVP